jgi:hypothetical protein
MGWLSVTTGSSSARLWWIRTLLLLLAVFAYGGTSVGARLVEFVGTEGATAVSQEATTARRHSTHSTRLSDGKTLEVARARAKAQPAHPDRRRPVDDPVVVSEYFSTPPDSRAPPAIA